MEMSVDNKELTLKLCGYECRGISTINLWGGGQGEVIMDTWDIPINYTEEDITKGVNDGGFGCESIEHAEVDIYANYEGKFIFMETVEFESEQLSSAKRGI